MFCFSVQQDINFIQKFDIVLTGNTQLKGDLLNDI